MKKQIMSAVSVLFLLLVLLPMPAQASGYTAAIHSVNVTADLNNDGSALITEVWDVTIKDGTEYYVSHYDLDNQTIQNLTVTDETGQMFKDVGMWDSGLSRSEKAGKSGLVSTKGGYEICWGFGEYGPHTYTVQYTLTNLVKGYSDANAITQVFIPTRGLDIEKVQITIRKDGVTFTQNDTGIWIFQIGADYGIENGELAINSNKPLKGAWQAAVMVQFDKAMFSPLDVRTDSFETIKEKGMQGSDYKPGVGDGDDKPGAGDSGFFNKLRRVFSSFGRIITILIVVALIGIGVAGSTGKNKKDAKGNTRTMKPEYKAPGYSRELPFAGSLPATYTRMDDLKQLPNEGAIIGAYLLRWVRSRQVDMVKYMGGIFGNKEEDAIRLYDARPGMHPLEASLYKMLVSAAGSDDILQSKEFEKWSKKNYTKVQAWIESYRNQGSAEMRQQGAISEEDAKSFFGLVSYKKQVITPVGETLTQNMFGFKKYLDDFTIINEREAREVQLWDEYLVFAQLFGIADKVAEQFKKLYPDYFVQMSAQMGTQMDMFDILLITRMANNYGWALSTGYRAGVTAHATTFSGGGGSSFGGGGGGGGFSGGGGGGGAGSR